MKQINKMQMLLVVLLMTISSCVNKNAKDYTEAYTQAEVDSIDHQATVEYDVRMKLDHELKLEPNHIFIDLEYAGRSGHQVLITQDTLTGKYYKW